MENEVTKSFYVDQSKFDQHKKMLGYKHETWKNSNWLMSIPEIAPQKYIKNWMLHWMPFRWFRLSIINSIKFIKR